MTTKIPGTKPWERSKKAARAKLGSLDHERAEKIIAKLLRDCHPKQRAFVEDPGRRVAALTARGAGKTTATLVRLLTKMLRIPRARVVFIATTREAARILIWEKLKFVTEALGIETDFKEVRLELWFPQNGSMLRLVGCDDMREIEKLRGQSFHEVAIDEAASHPKVLLEHLIDRIIGPRLGNYDGCIVLIGTPGHFLNGPFYDATRRGSEMHRPYEERFAEHYAGWIRWSSHTWNLQDGAATIPDLAKLWEEALVEKAAKNYSDDNPVWRREFLGEWSADDTDTVFKYRVTHNQWDPIRVGSLRLAKLPEDRKDWLYGYGLDLGFVDKFTCHAFAFSPSDPTRTIYHVYEFGAPGMYPRKIAELLIGEGLDAANPGGLIGATGYPAGMVADMAGSGESILKELLHVYGIPIAPVEKKRDDKIATIELLNGDLLDGRLKIMKGSQLETQMLALQWRYDEFGKPSENKSQANDHTDAAIYARRLIAVLFEREGAPPSTGTQSLQRRTPSHGLEPEPEPRRDNFTGMHTDGGFFDDYAGSWGND